MGKLSYMGTKTPLPIYGCCQSQIRCVPSQDPPSCHDQAPVHVVPHTSQSRPAMSTQESPSPPSCTLCKLGQTLSNFPTSLCATPQFWCSWKLFARGSSKGAPIFQRHYFSDTSIQVQQWLRATWSDPAIASKAPIIIQHRWPNPYHQSYCSLKTYPCTPGQHTSHNQDPM